MCVRWLDRIEDAHDIYLPSAFGQNPWCDEDAHHRDCADVGEEFPVCDVVCDPRQNCASNGKVNAEGDVNDEGPPVHRHVLEHCRDLDSKFYLLTNVKKKK